MYNYIDNSYLYMGMHRRLVAYDPRNTDNEIVLDVYKSNLFNDRRKNALIQLMLLEIYNQNLSTFTIFPVSLQMVFFDINVAWVEVIHQLLFTDKFVELFYGEYCNVLSKIVSCDSPHDKETVVYRYHATGETIFHLAGKVWLITAKQNHGTKPDVKKTILEELSNICNAYISLGKCFGNGKGDSILSIRDFSGKQLKQYLIDFSQEMMNVEA